jgi:2-keto-3-deoxy-L-rhamnonate aldolase RhmA
MAERVNRCIELLQQDQAIYYVGHHTGHVLTHAQGKADAATWADYINIGMEHGAFDMAGLAQYLRGLVDAGATRSGHRTPTVIIEAPVNGTDEANVRHNAWQFRQILGRGVHGIILCQAECPDAVRAFVESCRYPINTTGMDPAIPSPAARLAGAPRGPGGRRAPDGRPYLGIGTRGRGSETEAAAIWGIDATDYIARAEPWPLNPKGELMLGVKLESPEGVANCEAILDVPGLAYAEMGPGDLGLSLGYTGMQNNPYPPEMQAARDRILAACQARGIAYLEASWPENITQRIKDGVRVIAGQSEAAARIGRELQKRQMPA